MNSRLDRGGKDSCRLVMAETLTSQVRVLKVDQLHFDLQDHRHWELSQHHIGETNQMNSSE